MSKGPKEPTEFRCLSVKDKYMMILNEHEHLYEHSFWMNTAHLESYDPSTCFHWEQTLQACFCPAAVFTVATTCWFHILSCHNSSIFRQNQDKKKRNIPTKNASDVALKLLIYMKTEDDRVTSDQKRQQHVALREQTALTSTTTTTTTKSLVD